MLLVHINIQAFKNISLTFFNSASMISCGREFLRVIICFKQNYFLASILTSLPVKSTQQLHLCLALWSWIQGNFRMVFLQTSYYFVFQHDLYINIYTKKKHTTTHFCKQEKSRCFSRIFGHLLATKKESSRKRPCKVSCTQYTWYIENKKTNTNQK